MTTMNIINETGRLAVSMSQLVQDHPHLNLYPIASETIILLVSEQRGNEPPVWALAAQPQWAYSALGTICRERAFDAEQGKILIDGQRMKAEPYLTLWRKATYSPLQWQESLDAGILVTATISMPAAYIAAVSDGTAREARLQAFLETESGQAAKKDGSNWVWTIPMDRIDHMITFARLCDCYPNPQTYGQGKQVHFTVEHSTDKPVSAEACDDAAKADLIGEIA